MQAPGTLMPRFICLCLNARRRVQGQTADHPISGGLAVNIRCEDAHVDLWKDFTAHLAEETCGFYGAIALSSIRELCRSESKPINGALPEPSQSGTDVRHVQVLHSGR